MRSLALFFLVAVAIGGVAWVFLYPMLSGERQAERRKDDGRQDRHGRAARSPRATRRRARREQVEGTLKDLESAAGQEVRAAAPEDPAGRPELVEPAVSS